MLLVLFLPRLQNLTESCTVIDHSTQMLSPSRLLKRLKDSYDKLCGNWGLTGHCIIGRKASTTSAVDADPLRKRRLLSISSVSTRPLLGARTYCLALRFLIACRNYHVLTSRIQLRLLKFGLIFQNMAAVFLMCSNCADRLLVPVFGE